MDAPIIPHNVVYRPSETNTPSGAHTNLIKGPGMIGYGILAASALTGSAASAIALPVTVGALALYNWMEYKRRAEQKGQAAYFERWYRGSRERLMSPTAGLRSGIAHTMRQQTLMTLHNSAMYGRQVLGREAEILHA